MITVEILLGLVRLFAPVSDKPETYWATSGEVVLGYSAYAGWVPAAQCFNRCVTIPGQRPQLLAGELTVADMADLQLSIWRWNPVTGKNDQVLHCARWFDGSPKCFGGTP